MSEPTGEANVSEDRREAWHRDGALNATWLANSYHLGIGGLEEAEALPPQGLTPDQQVARIQMLTLTRAFLEKARDNQLERALTELLAWKESRKNG